MVLKKIHRCARCGRPLIKKINAEGFYWGCSNYPRCKKNIADKQGVPYYRAPFDYTCPVCRIGSLIKEQRYKKMPHAQIKKLFLWKCDNTLSCEAYFPDLRGKPKLKARPLHKSYGLKR